MIKVPDLYQIPLAEAEDLLSDLRLNFEVIDSTQFNPEIAPLSNGFDECESVKPKTIKKSNQPQRHKLVEVPRKKIY